MYWLNQEYQAHPSDSSEVFQSFPVPRVDILGWDGDARAGITDSFEDTTGYLPAGTEFKMNMIIRRTTRL